MLTQVSLPIWALKLIYYLIDYLIFDDETNDLQLTNVSFS